MEDVYPTVHEFKAHLDQSDPEETFEDLHRSNLVLAVGHVARRKLCQLDLDPYPTSLLCQGLDKLGDNKRAGVEYLSGMEYSTTVRVTIMDVMADLNEQLIGNDRAAEVAVEGLTTRVDDMVVDMDICYERFNMFGEDLTDVFHRLRDEEDKMEGVEQYLADTRRDIVMLIYDQEEIINQVDFLTEEWRELRVEVARLTTDLNHLVLAWFDQEVEYQRMRGQVDMLMAFQVVIQHGPGNPIEIEDDAEGEPDMGPPVSCLDSFGLHHSQILPTCVVPQFPLSLKRFPLLPHCHAHPAFPALSHTLCVSRICRVFPTYVARFPMHITCFPRFPRFCSLDCVTHITHFTHFPHPCHS